MDTHALELFEGIGLPPVPTIRTPDTIRIYLEQLSAATGSSFFLPPRIEQMLDAFMHDPSEEHLTLIKILTNDVLGVYAMLCWHRKQEFLADTRRIVRKGIDSLNSTQKAAAECLRDILTTALDTVYRGELKFTDAVYVQTKALGDMACLVIDDEDAIPSDFRYVKLELVVPKRLESRLAEFVRQLETEEAAQTTPQEIKVGTTKEEINKPALFGALKFSAKPIPGAHIGRFRTTEYKFPKLSEMLSAEQVQQLSKGGY